MDAMPLRFLVVEDEAILAMDIEGMIEEAGHKVVAEAASVPAVAQLPDVTHPDIALVDLHLAGGTNGIDASALIQKRWPRTLIVFVTANPTQVPADFAGACGIVGKPFTRQSFMSIIDYVAEGFRHPPPPHDTPDDFTAAPDVRGAWTGH